MTPESKSKAAEKRAVVDFFADLPDPRLDRKKKHLLIEIFAITLAAVVTGAKRHAVAEADAVGKAEGRASGQGGQARRFRRGHRAGHADMGGPQGTWEILSPPPSETWLGPGRRRAG